MKLYVWCCILCGKVFKSRRYFGDCPECGGKSAIWQKEEEESNATS